MRHVLVTGAAGLIGAAVCRQLAGEGIPFTAVWHDVEPPFECRHQCDLSVPGALEAIDSADAIVHLAALLPVSFDDCAEEAERNRRMDEHVLAAAERLRARLVYASTISLYAPGTGTGAVLDENAPLEPVGPYQQEKAWVEQTGLAWAERTGLAFTALRVCAPYGPGQRTRTVIQLFAERALAGGPLEYFGSGSREQDFTWAGDAAEAFVRALDGPTGAFNVASGRPVTMRELADVVAGVAGLEAGAVRAAGRPDPQEGTLARYDVTAARRHLGWSARTTLRAGIEHVLAERLEHVR
jgi:nucleoside-diphosphate-sugar epimerase